MRRSIQRLAISGLALGAVAWAHEPITTKLTWTQEISRIIYKRCLGCHRQGGKAMSFATYEEARPWAKAIRDEVAERRMPPWGAVKGFGAFRDDASLTDPEIEMLVLWVEGGAPKGDDIYLPPLPLAPALAKGAPGTQGVLVHGKTTLSRGIVATGVSSREMAPETQMRIIAKLPDGSVENLIWLRNAGTEWKRSFYFRQPMTLPKGTVIVVDAGAAVILTGKPGA
jgi:hypothetical protein